MPESTRVNRWQRVRTDAGWHLRVVATNGEPVLWSETYEDPRAVENAVYLAITAVAQTGLVNFRGSFGLADIEALLEDTDERTTQ